MTLCSSRCSMCYALLLTESFKNKNSCRSDCALHLAVCAIRSCSQAAGKEAERESHHGGERATSRQRGGEREASRAGERAAARRHAGREGGTAWRGLRLWSAGWGCVASVPGPRWHRRADRVRDVGTQPSTGRGVAYLAQADGQGAGAGARRTEGMAAVAGGGR